MVLVSFQIKTMFGSSLPSVVCRKAHVLYIFACYAAANRLSFLCCVLCLFVFVLCLVYPMLPVSLDCPFSIVLSVFSNVYLSCVLYT